MRTDRSLDLTDKGRDLATAVMRKHRLAERLLTDVLGLDIAKVHDEACRWEHVMSEEVEKRMVAVLDDPTRSPFGNPIPALSALGFDAPQPDQGTRAVDLPNGDEVSATVIQVNEILQVDDGTFQELTAAGIRVGAKVSVVNNSGTITLSTPDGGSVVLSDDLAHAVRVEV